MESVFKRLQSEEHPLNEAAVREVLLELAADISLLEAFEKFDDYSYTRNRIFKNEIADLLVLCWKPGQRTPIHDHAGSTCGVSILKGTASEIAFTRSASSLLLPDKVSTLSAGDISVNRDNDIHIMGNFESSTDDLVTLHCYSPPLKSMTVYQQSETFLASYDELTSRSLNTRL